MLILCLIHTRHIRLSHSRERAMIENLPFLWMAHDPVRKGTKATGCKEMAYMVIRPLTIFYYLRRLKRI